MYIILSMAENIEALSTEDLKKKIKTLGILASVMAGFSIVIGGAIVYVAFVLRKSVTTLVILLPVIYLPVVLMGSARKKYTAELAKRGEK